VVDAIYLASDEATMWAEWYRHLAERGIPPLQQLPRDVWRYRVETTSPPRSASPESAPIDGIRHKIDALLG